MDVIQQRRRPRKSLVPYQLLGVNTAVRLAKGDVPLARDLAEGVIDRHRLEIAPEVLFALERLEQSLEIPRPEALRAFALDDLVEQRRTIFHRFREDLQEVTF